MNNRSLLIGLSFLLPSLAGAQGNWRAADIPDSLKNDGQSAVVRLFDVTFKAKGKDAGVCTFHRVVTVMDKRGDDYADWKEGTEEGTENITSFRGFVLNADGKVLEKVKKSDTHLYAYSEEVANDAKVNYYEHPAVLSYPYTVEYEWEVKYTNGLRSYPWFDPIDGSNQSMQECHYTLILDPGTEIDYRCLNTNAVFSKTSTKEGDVYKWTLPAQRAILDTDYRPMAMFVYPGVMAHSRVFTYGGVAGSLESWEKLGAWTYSLGKDRDILPQAEQDRIKAMTDALPSQMDKIGALYKYLGEKTRYVSIQLGIGGYQPMPAEEVARTGFGDCKALSNYMKAMLQVIGVKSYLCDISTKYENLLPDFPNFNQIDHVILCVPMDRDTLWLDCTAAADIPFPNVPYRLKGHQCMLITENGGVVKRIPAPKPEENTVLTRSEVYLKYDGTISKGLFSVSCLGEMFERYIHLCDKDDKKKLDVVNSLLNLNNTKVTDLKIDKHAEGTPEIDIRCNFTASYGRKSGSRIFIPTDFLATYKAPRFTAHRRIPIEISRDVMHVDTIIVHIPDNLKIESMPGWVQKTDGNVVKSDFGQIESSIANIDDHTFRVVIRMNIRKGTYPVSAKDDFTNFFKTVSKRMSDSFVLVQNP